MGLFSKSEPIILKEGSSATEQLAALEALRGRVPASAERRLEADIRAVKAGIEGERRVLYELKNSHMDMVVIQDLFLEFEGRQAQIDFLVLTRQRNFVIECKSLYGNILINNKGDFIRTYRGRKEPEGFYSPFTQNRRHLQLIREMKASTRGKLGGMVMRGAFDDLYKSLIVLANEKTVVDDSAAPKEIRESIVRADRLVSAIGDMNAKAGLGRDKMPMKDVRENAEWFLERDKGSGGADFAARYREMASATAAEPNASEAGSGEAFVDAVPQHQNIPVQERTPVTPQSQVASLQARVPVETQPQAVAAPACPKCGAPMVVRTARRGARTGKQFFGCTRFPECRGIVNIEPDGA